MDSRGGRYGSDYNSESGGKNGRKSSSRRNSGDQGLAGQSGRGSPSNYYYYGVSPAGDITEPRREEVEENLYARNNNDYSKYNGGHLPSTSDYGYYASGSEPGDYSASSYDVNSNDTCGSDYSYGYQEQHHCSNGSYPHCQPGHSGCDDPQCYGDVHEGDSRSCSLPQCAGDRCNAYGSCGQREYAAPSRVQVTAKVLFGSVSAISNLKQKKCTKK